MIHALIFSVNAVFPIILLSAFGFYIRNNGTLSDSFLKEGNRFCFQYAFMAMMFINIYKLESLSFIRWDVIICATLAIFVLFLAGLFYVLFFVPQADQKGVIHQAFYRSNYATIGLPLAFNIGGSDALQLASLISAFSVTLFNIFAVISLSVFINNKQQNTMVFVLKQIAKNPLIKGVAIGMACVTIRPYCGDWRFSTGHLRFLYKSIDALGTIAPWFSLIILGGQFKFSAVKRLLRQITASTLARLILAPTTGLCISMFVPPLLGFKTFRTTEYAALFALFASPIAVASVPMADQMHGDSELAGQILVWTSLFSIFSLFGFTAIFRRLGIF